METESLSQILWTYENNCLIRFYFLVSRSNSVFREIFLRKQFKSNTLSYANRTKWKSAVMATFLDPKRKKKIPTRSHWFRVKSILLLRLHWVLFLYSTNTSQYASKCFIGRYLSEFAWCDKSTWKSLGFMGTWMIGSLFVVCGEAFVLFYRSKIIWNEIACFVAFKHEIQS